MNKKIIYISIGVTVFLLLIMGVSIVLMNSGGPKMNKSMDSTVKGYIEKINKGNYVEAYKTIATSSHQTIGDSSYTEFISILMDEKNVRLEIDDKKKPISGEIQLSKTEKLKVINIPIIRAYQYSADGEKYDIKEEMVLSMIDENGASKVYYSPNMWNEHINKFILDKANRAAVELLQNKNDEKIVAKNAEIIDRCVRYINTAVSSEYEKYQSVLFESNIMTAYKFFALGDVQNAMNSITAAYNSVETVEEKIRAKRVEGELHKIMGDYNSAVKVLSEALELDPTNKDVRKEYRDVNDRMLDKIESSLSSGWIELKSALKQRRRERQRILEDLALNYAEEAIKVKTDAPDGYYLKGNVLYCLGQYSEAVTVLEVALNYVNDEDTLFRNKVSEILGMAKVAANTMGEVKFNADSYSAIFNPDIRSYVFRESEVGGLIDAAR